MSKEKFSDFFSGIMLVMLFGGAFMIAFSFHFVGFWLYYLGFLTMLASPFPAIIELKTREKRRK